MDVPDGLQALLESLRGLERSPLWSARHEHNHPGKLPGGLGVSDGRAARQGTGGERPGEGAPGQPTEERFPVHSITGAWTRMTQRRFVTG